MARDDERERVWATVHDAVARMPGWAVGPCTYHGEEARWHVTAIDLRSRSRYAKRETITATGATEIAALGALVELLAARVARVTTRMSLVGLPEFRTPRVLPANLIATSESGR